MRFLLTFIALAFLAGCACEHDAAVKPQAAPLVASNPTAIHQLEPAEKEALYRAGQEITSSCAQGRAEADLPRGQFAAYDGCATALYDRYLLPVTAYRDEFHSYRAHVQEAARQYDRGDLTYTQLQERRKSAWFGYLANRQMRGLSSYERFQADDAELRARYESIVQGTPGLVSPQCDYRYGC